MKLVVHDAFKPFHQQIENFIKNFDKKGIPFGSTKRNSIKLFELDNMTINVKSFKVPNLINQFIYRFFRKSKAHRSFEYAKKLTQLNIGTPTPIAFFENRTAFLFKQSYYVSEHLDNDITYRELSRNLNYPDHENILRAFTRFTFKLHENQILFLDHSPGNTLIKKTASGYDFYLVDLNRMKFKELGINQRIKNFSRLTPHKEIVEIMSDEYAKCLKKDYQEVFELMWKFTERFQEKYHRKKRLKKKLKFW